MPNTNKEAGWKFTAQENPDMAEDINTRQDKYGSEDPGPDDLTYLKVRAISEYDEVVDYEKWFTAGTDPEQWVYTAMRKANKKWPEAVKLEVLCEGKLIATVTYHKPTIELH
jgi:hypothetical protein